MPDNQQVVPNRAVDQLLIKAANTIKNLPSGGVTSMFGYNYAGGIADDQAYRAKLYPTPGETYDQWIGRVDKELPGFGALMGQQPHEGAITDQQGVQRKLTWDMLQGGKIQGLSPQEIESLRTQAQFADPNNLGGSEKLGGPGASGPSGTDLMREFAMHMMAPIDQNDPYVQQVVRAASGASQTDARNRGLQGGYAVANGERAVAGALTASQLQRQQLGAQAMGSAEGIDLQQAQLAQQAYAQQYQAQMGQLQNAYAQKTGLGQGIGGVIGGIGGGIIGAYAGGPAGAQAGMTLGSQVGGGIGGMAAGGGQAPYLPYQPPAIGRNNRGGV